MQVDQWLDFSSSIVSGAGLEAVCGVVDQFLSLRTYLVGYQLTIADLQVWGQLQGDTCAVSHTGLHFMPFFFSCTSLVHKKI